MRRKTFGIIFGALLVAAGVILALKEFGVMQIDSSVFEGWWSLFIIVPAIDGLIRNKDKIGSLLVLAIGVYLLLAARGIIEYGMFWQLLLPVIVVLCGAKIIIKSVRGEKKDRAEPAEDHAAVIDKKDGEKSKITRVGAVFGGSKCNLTDADFSKTNEIELLCVFGGAEIIVPEDVEIVVNSFCLFGGVSDKRSIKSDTEKRARLIINGFCLFGGADIK